MDNQKNIFDKKIDLSKSLKIISKRKTIILRFILAFLILGVFIAFGSKVEYESSCKLLPESQEGIQPNLGRLNNLAGLAGINLDFEKSGNLTPDLYPEISNSYPFLIDLLNDSIQFSYMDTLLTSYDYFYDVDKPSLLSIIFKYSFGLPFIIKEWISKKNEDFKNNNIKGDEILFISKKEYELIEDFKKRINIEVDDESGIITIRSKMPDPLAAAEIANRGVKILTQFITEYKISKAKERLDFISERYFEAQVEFENAEKKLAIFSDENRNVISSLAQTELNRLQNQYDLTFDVYRGLALQLEEAKIKVKEDTPIFTILEPVKAPVEKSSPRRLLTLFVCLFIGLLSGIGFVFFFDFQKIAS